MPRIVLLLAALWGAQDLVDAWTQQQAREADLPNVVLFLIDDVADSDIDAIRTPALDDLASRGMRFRRAYSHAYCQPTRDSLFYSRWLGRSRGVDCAGAVPATQDHGLFNIVSVFEAAGYSTAHFGKWHLGSNRIGPWEMTPHLRGYDYVRAGMPIGCPQGGQRWLRLDDGQVRVETVHRTIALRNAFRDWWTATEGPKFAFVNFLAAHSPFEIPPASILYPWVSFTTYSNRERFEAEVIGVDFVLSELLPLIESNTLILFLGDNGTPGNSPYNPSSVTNATRPDQDPERVKLSCYEDGVRVPLIVAHPKLPHGVETNALVHVVDLLPTLADLIGLPVGAPIAGESFADVLVGDGPGRDWLFVYSPGRPDRAVITPRWKLLTTEDRREELYDLADDPTEKNPLPAVGPIADELRALRASVLTAATAPRSSARHLGALRTTGD